MADYALTRFGRLLQDHWMWLQRPPLNATRAAELLGISNSTMSRWLNTTALPPKEKIPEIHARTGLPLADLYASCDYIPPPDIWEYIIANLRDDVAMLPPTRQHVITRIQELRRHYETEIKRASEAAASTNLQGGTIIFTPDENANDDGPHDPPDRHGRRRRDSAS